MTEKILKILKDKMVNVYFIDWAKTLKRYNKFVTEGRQLTQEEWNLLVAWLYAK